MSHPAQRGPDGDRSRRPSRATYVGGGVGHEEADIVPPVERCLDEAFGPPIGQGLGGPAPRCRASPGARAGRGRRWPGQSPRLGRSSRLGSACSAQRSPVRGSVRWWRLARRDRPTWRPSASRVDDGDPQDSIVVPPAAAIPGDSPRLGACRRAGCAPHLLHPAPATHLAGHGCTAWGRAHPPAVASGYGAAIRPW